MITDTLLALHLIGLMFGAAGGIASGLVMRQAAAAAPEQAMTLRSLGPRFSQMSIIGLVLMWVTGGVLVTQRGGFEALPQLFWLKLIFVVSLTIAAVTIHLSYAQIKRGNAAAAARLPVLGPIAGMSAFLAVIVAVFTFH